MGSALILGYTMKLEPKWGVLTLMIVNVPFYSMEVKHKISNNLNMILGELGAVECKRQ